MPIHAPKACGRKKLISHRSPNGENFRVYHPVGQVYRLTKLPINATQSASKTSRPQRQPLRTTSLFNTQILAKFFRRQLFLPPTNHNRSHSIADKIRDRSALAHKSVDT